MGQDEAIAILMRRTLVRTSAAVHWGEGRREGIGIRPVGDALLTVADGPKTSVTGAWSLSA